jgi:hypothetical protein
MTALETINDATPIDPAAIDCDTREGVIARRNVLIGLWAARRLGLSGDEAEAYAWSVHLADRSKPGHDDVVAKIATDLARAQTKVCERSIRRYLREMELRAFFQLSVELGLSRSGARHPPI